MLSTPPALNETAGGKRGLFALNLGGDCLHNVGGNEDAFSRGTVLRSSAAQQLLQPMRKVNFSLETPPR